MIFGKRSIHLFCSGLLACLFSSAVVSAESPDVGALLQQVDAYPHTEQVEFSERDVIDYEVGLGAIQKIRGEWHFKKSERLNGTLLSYTWLIGNGFSAAEVMDQLLDNVGHIKGSSELFACEGRACGRAVQWANRVFNQRVLFGREDLQRYRVYSLQDEPEARLLAYSAERTADRQYLHVEWLLVTP
ncbi:Uncharacterised protein [Halioglobus japonicus]|nr:Uncharacterised protein [Halioglobus japonicus]